MTNAIHPKVRATGVAGAVSILVIWVLAQFGIDATPEVGAAIAAVLSFAAGFFKSA